MCKRQDKRRFAAPAHQIFSTRFLTDAAPGINGRKSVRAVAEDEPLASSDFVAAVFGQAGVVSVKGTVAGEEAIFDAPDANVFFQWRTLANERYYLDTGALDNIAGIPT